MSMCRGDVEQLTKDVMVTIIEGCPTDGEYDTFGMTVPPVLLTEERKASRDYLNCLLTDIFVAFEIGKLSYDGESMVFYYAEK